MKPFHFTFGDSRSMISFHETIDLSDSETKSLTVFDKNTFTLFGRKALNPVILPPGESNKSWKSVDKIIRKAVREGLGRDSLIIGVGGGVVCDLAAFSASVYMRGCRLLLIPTSLLAMVDAAIGGKTGIDFMNYKNIVGTFYPAEEVRICIHALHSLSERELKAGLAEAIKTALIGDADLVDLLSENREQVLAGNTDLLKKIVCRCIKVKGCIVEEDFREAGKRAVLNLGHTFGHALETAGALKNWKHGEAVAWGLAKALDLGERLGITDPGYSRSVKMLLSDYNFNLFAGLADKNALLRAMKSDKKRQDGKLRFILQKNICDTVIEFVKEEDILAVLEKP